jgi:hypothetical protein
MERRQACPSNPTSPTTFFSLAMKDQKVDRSVRRQFQTLHELLNLL